jgi:hypothetical protein
MVQRFSMCPCAAITAASNLSDSSAHQAFLILTATARNAAEPSPYWTSVTLSP